MRKLQKHLALTLAVLLAFTLLPGQLWAMAYDTLLEPNMDNTNGGPAYGDVFMVWDEVYSLVEYTNGGLQTISTETYTYMTDFSAEGYAGAYKQDGGFCVIDYTGKTVVPAGYDYISDISDDGYTIADKDGVSYLLNVHDGSAQQLSFNATGVSDGRISVLDENWDYYYTDLSGNTVIPGPFVVAEDFHEGYAYVGVPSEEGGLNGMIIDTNGNVVLSNDPNSGFEFSGYVTVHNGLVPAYNYGEQGSFGYMDLSGNVVISGYDYGEDFHNGYAAVYGESGVALIDTQGSVVVPAGLYDYFSPVSSTGLVFAGNYKTAYDPEYGYEMTQPTLAAVLRVGSGSAAPATPSEPSTPTQPAQPAGVTANPTAASVLVDGEAVAFDAYSIDGNNYFKLRDLAYVLNATPKQFSVDWDGAANAISLTSGAAYTPVGGEMTAGSAESRTASPTASKILLDGAEVAFTAYNIGGNNYFKLRDVGQALNFGIGWDSATKTITIETAAGYTA